MIKYNNSNINDWYFYTSDIIKVCRNNVVIYYKLTTSGGTPEYKVCYAVVDDISSYQDTEFEDVYDKTTEKWYKLNNLSQYEEYGVYGSGRNITYYDGKLTFDNGYEYQYSGNSWVNVGEVSGGTKTSGFTSEDIGDRITSGLTDGERILISYYNQNGTSDPNYIMSYENYSPYYASNLYRNGITSIDSTTVLDSGIWQLEATTTADTYYIKNVNNGMYWGYQIRTSSRSFYLVDNASKIPVLITPSCMENCFGFVEQTTNSTSYGGYGLNQLNGHTYDLNWWNNNGDDACEFFGDDGNADFVLYKVGSLNIYPVYYDTKSAPLNNLSFSSMTEADTYAYNNCVYDGMNATIDGDRYSFDADEGWVEIPYYYMVEDVTPSSYGGSGWTVTDSDTYNPNKVYYDDYSVEQTSSSYTYRVAKVTIFGYENFTYYLRSSGYSNYAYVVATNVDEFQSDPSYIQYSDSRAITNTYNWNKTPKADVNLSNYRRVTYNNLDKTVEHTFYVSFYNGFDPYHTNNATLLIPKDQTNENWEQVTFSVYPGVNAKGLYIDGNNSTSGGTSCFYKKWMIGLPSGSHSSYVTYDDFEYCPSVTSSTFTSVDGGVREVDYSYTYAQNKSLQFRLVDESGNTITTADTVYYNMTINNGCGKSTNNNNLAFPRSQDVKVGGIFYFTSSENRHYIYGYVPNISMGGYYYTDNYSTYFDIPYAKLDEEAVTITYTTYDPSDSETPAFSTNVSYPYGNSGSTTFSTTSYNVPYTYSYEVSQTNNLFSADSQSFTASESARTITFTLYPNNRTFSTVADLEAYQYAYEGMIAYVDDTTYKYENGEWVENQRSLPDIPFVLNYNAKQYDASTHTIPYTEGALNEIDAVINGTTANIIDHSSDGYIQLTGSSYTTIRALVGTTNFSRDSSNPNITIICKAYTPGNSSEGSILTNRYETYNWMYRHKSFKLTFHGTSEQGLIAVSNSEPNTCSIRVDSNRLLTYNNWTQETTSTYTNFEYGNTSNGGALFAGYYDASDEMWKGVFYWIYMSLNTLTDEQVQQVIDYNENL